MECQSYEIYLSEVMEEISSLSALQGYVALPERERALLQDDQQEGLRVLIEDAFADIVLELMPKVADFGMTDELFWIEVKDEYATGFHLANALRAVMKRAAAQLVLGAIYVSTDEGREYTMTARRGMALVRDHLEEKFEGPHLVSYR